MSTPAKIATIDHEKKRTFVLQKDGMPDAGTFPPSTFCIFSRSSFLKTCFCVVHCSSSSSSELKKFLFCIVVWNPWDKKAKALPDLGDEDYKTMLCVDSAAIETPISLKPFEEWRGCQEISTVSSSYCSGQLDPRKVLHSFR